MNCDFDSCELWNGIILGVISSFAFAVLTFLFNKYILYKLTYGKIAGHYKGYGYKQNNDTELNDNKFHQQQLNISIKTYWKSLLIIATQMKYLFGMENLD